MTRAKGTMPKPVSRSSTGSDRVAKPSPVVYEIPKTQQNERTAEMAASCSHCVRVREARKEPMGSLYRAPASQRFRCQSFPISEFTNALTMDITIEAKNALPNPEIQNPIPKRPFASHAARYSMMVFTIR